MIRLKSHRVDYKNNNTPILSHHEIDEFAHAVLEDYKPELLREPGKINYQHFLESYLGMQIAIHDLYYDDPEQPILAMTVFDDWWIKVFDRENNCVKEVFIPARTVIIDASLMVSEKEAVALFSGMHEGGHITMQWHVFTGKTLDGYAYDPDGDCEFSEEIFPYVCCRRDNIESTPTKKKVRTAEEWREYHADYFAAAITMPNATFKPFVNRFLRENGYYRSSITLGRDEELDILADDLLPDAISDTYGVSKRAARIKLRTSGFVYGNMKETVID